MRGIHVKVKTLSGGQLVAALLAAEDSFTMLHPYVLLQDSCGAKFFGTLFTHVLCIVVLGGFVNPKISFECRGIVTLVTIMSRVGMLPEDMQFEQML